MKINISKLSTKDLATLAQRVINSSKSNNYKVVEGNELLAGVEAQYAIYDKVYAKLTFSGKGTEVAAADEVRDNLFNGMKMMLKGLVKLNMMPTYDAATVVLGVFNKYGIDLDKLSYAEETAQMKKLVEELSGEDMTGNLDALSMTDIFGKLKQAQADFEELYAEQAEANADLRALPSATSARKGLEKALRSYFDLLTAMSGVPSWQMIYQDISEIVKGSENSSRSATTPRDPNYKPMNPPRTEETDTSETTE